jgi:hypothetical protein
MYFKGVPRRLFFAAQQRMAITWSPNYNYYTEFWLQIVEVAITSVGMSVQWLTIDYVHYFTI